MFPQQVVLVLLRSQDRLLVLNQDNHQQLHSDMKEEETTIRGSQKDEEHAEVCVCVQVCEYLVWSLEPEHRM